jgi:hypothetical protein
LIESGNGISSMPTSKIPAIEQRSSTLINPLKKLIVSLKRIFQS